MFHIKFAIIMKKIILLAFTTLTMFACTKDQEKDVITNTNSTSQVENDLIRYANADENVIDYKTAKYLTYLELERGAKDFLNLGDNYELSNIPRIIYDYDNLPKYYEFDVLVNKTLKYTVTSHAKKEDTSVIAFMFEYNKQSVKNNSENILMLFMEQKVIFILHLLVCLRREQMLPLKNAYIPDLMLIIGIIIITYQKRFLKKKKFSCLML